MYFDMYLPLQHLQEQLSSYSDIQLFNTELIKEEGHKESIFVIVKARIDSALVMFTNTVCAYRVTINSSCYSSELLYRHDM